MRLYLKKKQEKEIPHQPNKPQQNTFISEYVDNHSKLVEVGGGLFGECEQAMILIIRIIVFVTLGIDLNLLIEGKFQI